MSINSVLPIATNSLRMNAKVIADASRKIVEQPAQGFSESVVVDLSEGSVPTSPPVDNKVNLIDNERFSDQDLLTQTLRIKHAEVAYKASASLIRTADDMSDVLLDAMS